MTPKQSEIVEGLEAISLIPGSFDKMLIRSWASRLRQGLPLTESGARHLPRLLKKYRKQLPELYTKHIKDNETN